MTTTLDPTRGDELLAVSRNVDRFFPLLETLEQDGKSPEVLALWMRISANYCADNAATAPVTIVATRSELGPAVQDVLGKFGRAATPAARSKVWSRVAPDVELALSVMMSAAVTITDRLPHLPARSILSVEQLCRLFANGDTAAAMAAARIVVGAATDHRPPLRLGLNQAVLDGAAGTTARCLLILAAAAIDAGTVPLEMTKRADHDLDSVTDPAQRAQIIAVRVATAEAAGDGVEAVEALLADVDDSELVHLLTSWGEIAATALTRTAR